MFTQDNNSSLVALLSIRGKLKEKQATEFQFTVEFKNEDGSRFSLRPCCGEEVTNEEHLTEFIYIVRLECTGKCKVMEPPVYLP